VRHCPNDACPGRRKKAAAEYHDDVDTCHDCAAALVDGPAVRPAAAPRSTRARTGIEARLAVTAFGLLLPLALQRIVAPGFDAEALRHVLGPIDIATVSLGALGLTPFLSAFLVVELIALVVPALRPLRHAGPEGRAKLQRASVVVAGAFAVYQAFALVQWGQAVNALSSLADGPMAKIQPMAAVLAGAGALYATTVLVDRRGLGNGFSVVLVGSWLPGLVGAGGVWTLGGMAGSSGVLIGLCLVAVLATVVVLTGHRRQGGASLPRLPTCGTVPLVVMASLPPLWALVEGQFVSRALGDRVLSVVFGLLAFAHNVTTSDIPVDGWSWVAPTTFAAGLILLAAGLSFVFQRPSSVAELARQAKMLAPTGQSSRALVRAAALSSVFVLVLFGIAVFHAEGAASLPLLALTVLAAVALDVFGEIRARLEHGELVRAWPLHQLYAVDPALKVLRDVGIPAYPRGAYHRGLLHFFGPYVPVDILVPAARAAEADRVLEQLFFADIDAEEAAAVFA
jgi:hypothetical protein